MQPTPGAKSHYLTSSASKLPSRTRTRLIRNHENILIVPELSEHSRDVQQSVEDELVETMVFLQLTILLYLKVIVKLLAWSWWSP